MHSSWKRLQATAVPHHPIQMWLSALAFKPICSETSPLCDTEILMPGEVRVSTSFETSEEKVPHESTTSPMTSRHSCKELTSVQIQQTSLQTEDFQCWCIEKLWLGGKFSVMLFFYFACCHFIGVSTVAGDRQGQCVYIDHGYRCWKNMRKNLLEHNGSKKQKGCISMEWVQGCGCKESIDSQIDANRLL